jgi:hypothetical protein
MRFRENTIAGRIANPALSDLQASFKGALAWIERVTNQKTGRTGYKAPGDEGALLTQFASLPEGYPFTYGQAMTAVGVFCRLRLGQSKTRDAIKRGAETLIAKEMPEWRFRKGKDLSPINYYYWYYGTRAFSLYGGRTFDAWKTSLNRALLAHQRRKGDATAGGCEAGSWDPVDPWSIVGGRVYATAICALTLEACAPAKKK